MRILERDAMSNPQMMTANPGALFGVGLVAMLCVTVCDAVLTIAVSDGYLNGEIDLARAFSTGMRKIMAVSSRLVLSRLCWWVSPCSWSAWAP